MTNIKSLHFINKIIPSSILYLGGRVSQYFQSDDALFEAVDNFNLSAIQRELYKGVRVKSTTQSKRSVLAHLLNEHNNWPKEDYIEAFKALASAIDLTRPYCADIAFHDEPIDLMMLVLASNIPNDYQRQLIEIMFELGFNRKSSLTSIIMLGSTIMDRVEDAEEREKIFQLMLAKKAGVKLWDINEFEIISLSSGKSLKETLLTYSVSQDQLDTAKILIRLGANIDEVDWNDARFYKKDQSNALDSLNDTAKYMIGIKNTIDERQALQEAIGFNSNEAVKSVKDNAGQKPNSEALKKFKV